MPVQIAQDENRASTRPLAPLTSRGLCPGVRSFEALGGDVVLTHAARRISGARTRQGRETAKQTMSGEAELEFVRIWRPIPKVVSIGGAGLAAAAMAEDLIARTLGSRVVYLCYQRTR